MYFDEEFVCSDHGAIANSELEVEVKGLYFFRGSGSTTYRVLNLGIYMEDGKYELSVLVDSACGGSSIQDGQLEIMLHRRIFVDDGRGVGEALDEIVCIENDCEGLTSAMAHECAFSQNLADPPPNSPQEHGTSVGSTALNPTRGKYHIGISQLGDGANWRRTNGQQIYSPVLLAFTHEDENIWKSSRITKATSMAPGYSLPPNVALITLEELDDATVLLRLAHLYEAGEDARNSVLAAVELKKIFGGKSIKKVVETSLSANQNKAEMKKKNWRVEGENETNHPAPLRGGPLNNSTLIVELGPMEIRTFLLTFEKHARRVAV
ncbi:hypothetical protein KSP40_PGU019060 [Platanthera guangdongensis]|uniref:Glycosyl hydrolase family 38 C-terminal domain-containing protein n=1 Tax=Platanthera guangdongensis TaxID=2320717 RepID=A0ABR2LPM7_9ASPA